MDIDALASKYGGVSRSVVARAKENQRRAAARAAASAGQDLAVPVASLVVAARALDESLDARRLATLAGVSTRAVDSCVQRLLVVLGAGEVVRTTPAALCIRFGCEAIAEIVGRVFAEYQHRASARRRGGGGGRADAKEPVFMAACLLACSKQANLRVDRAKLLDFVCGSSKEFDAMVSSIEATCAASLSGAVRSKRKTRAASSTMANGAAVADDADADADASRRHCRPIGGSPAPAASPRRVSPRRLERLGRGSPGTSSSALARLRSPTGRSPRACRALSLPSTDEYAAWRAAALAYMRHKRADRRRAQGDQGAVEASA